MEGLRWWLLLLTAIMFSMAGCAMQDWSSRSTNQAHVTSARHFDGRSGGAPVPTVLVLARASR